MGFWGFWKKSISNKEIDDIVMSYFQELGSPRNIGQKEHADNFIKMLNKLDQWAESNCFGNWKRSVINGNIEAILRKTYQNCGINDIVSDYIKKSYKIIMKM